MPRWPPAPIRAQSDGGGASESTAWAIHDLLRVRSEACTSPALWTEPEAHEAQREGETAEVQSELWADVVRWRCLVEGVGKQAQSFISGMHEREFF